MSSSSTPNYHSPLELKLKDDQFIKLNQASSSSPASRHSFFEPVQQPGFYHKEPHMLQQATGSCDRPGSAVMDESGSGSVKWMSSKMRLRKKMMNSDAVNNSCMQKLEDHQKQTSSSSLETDNSSYSNNTNTNTIRVCADCNTTKTPLWRSGPRGPKSLCNACGIRQRKARRAMAAAAAAAATENGTAVQLVAADGSISNKKMGKVQDKDKTSRGSKNSCLPFKKRCKFTDGPSYGKKKMLCFEDLSIILNKNNSALQRVFPQDEKEAAILLMALSYGLVHG